MAFMMPPRAAHHAVCTRHKLPSGLRLARMRRDRLDGRREARVRCPFHRLVANPKAGGMLAEKVVAAPVACRPDRPRCESATAVRAHVLQHRFDTCRAERALEAADARVG